MRRGKQPAKGTPLRIGLFVDLLAAHGRGIFMGIAEYARVHGWTLIHRNPWNASDLDAAAGNPVDLHDMGRLDGLIASCHDRRAETAVRAVRLPTVNISSVFDGSSIPSVCTDAAAVGALAASHLLQSGLGHFAMLERGQSKFRLERQHAFVAAVRQAGFQTHLLTLSMNLPRPRRRQMIADWLKGLPLPVGLAVLHDFTALEVQRICQDLHLAIPEQVAVLGCDDEPLVQRMADPPLSSIRLNLEHNGALAAKLLDDLLHGRPVPQKRVLVPPLGVATRVSTDILAIGEPDLRLALQFIREHAASPITVADVLRAVPLSRRPLEKRFRRVLGRTILEEIHRSKIERGKRLLLETRLPIAQVATACGMSSPARFSITFRAVTGSSPTQYLSQIRPSFA